MLKSVGYVGIGTISIQGEPCCALGWWITSLGLTFDEYGNYWGLHVKERVQLDKIYSRLVDPSSEFTWALTGLNDKCDDAKLRRIRIEATLKILGRVEEISPEAQKLVDTYKEKFDAANH